MAMSYMIEEVPEDEIDKDEPGGFRIWKNLVMEGTYDDERFQTAEEAFDWIKRQESISPWIDVLYKDGKYQSWNLDENAQEKFERLAKELFQLCEENNWGDPSKLLSEQRERLSELKKDWQGVAGNK